MSVSKCSILFFFLCRYISSYEKRRGQEHRIVPSICVDLESIGYLPKVRQKGEKGIMGGWKRKKKKEQQILLLSPVQNGHRSTNNNNANW